MDATARQVNSTLWWVLLVQGLLGLAFGFAALFWPGVTLVTLVYLFSFYIVASGIMTIIMGVSRIGNGSMWLLGVILGIFELVVGVYAVRHVGITVASFILLVGAILVVRGIVEIVSAFVEAPPEGSNKGLLVLVGSLSLLTGIYILLNPASGGLAFVWALGAYALIAGTMSIVRSISSKTLADGV